MVFLQHIAYSYFHMYLMGNKRKNLKIKYNYGFTALYNLRAHSSVSISCKRTIDNATVLCCCVIYDDQP